MRHLRISARGFVGVQNVGFWRPGSGGRGARRGSAAYTVRSRSLRRICSDCDVLLLRCVPSRARLQ
eukprot:15473589-Alexandrium_andersonii.AAC.1